MNQMLESENRVHGFYGTMKCELRPELWSAAMTAVMDRANCDADTARRLLDSSLGRHIADRASDLMGIGWGVEEAIEKSVREAGRWDRAGFAGLISKLN